MQINPEVASRESLADASNKETILKLLDSELSMLSQQQTNSGWTSWALVGAIGAICWTLLGQWEAGWPSGGTWLFVYLALSFVRFVIQAFLSLSGDEAGMSTGQTRFYLGSGSRYQRTQAVYGFLQIITLVLVLIVYPATMPTKIGAFVFCALVFLIWVYEFFMSFTQRPRRVQQASSTSTSIFVGRLLVFVFILTVTFSLGQDLLKMPLKAADLKVGGLLVVTAYLIQQTIEVRGSRSLIGSLVNIRRELALGVMPAKEAARHIEIQFLGMRVSDVFRDSAQNFLSQSGSVTARCQEYVRRIDNVIEGVRKNSSLPSNQQESILKSAQDAHQAYVAGIDGELEALGATFKKIESRSHFFLSSPGDAGVAMRDILTNLHASYLDASTGFQQFSRRMSELDLLVKNVAVRKKG